MTLTNYHEKCCASIPATDLPPTTCEWAIMSKIVGSLHDDLAAHEAGAVSRITMREFDAICPPPISEQEALDILTLVSLINRKLDATTKIVIVLP